MLTFNGMLFQSVSRSDSLCRTAVLLLTRLLSGMKLAYMFMFITIARTLATFKIAPANGKDLPTFVALEGILKYVH